MEDLADALGIVRVERGEVGPAEAARAVAAVGQHELADVERLAGRQRGFQQVAGGLDIDERHAVLDRQVDDLPHPDEIIHPVEPQHLVELLPARGAVLRLVPGAEGEGGHAEIGAGEVLGRAQDRHARRGVPRAFLAVRIAVDHPDVADALADQIPACGLAAHAGADHQHVEHPLAVGTGAFGHPVGRRIVQPGEIVPRDPLRSFQTGYALDNTDHAVLLTLCPFNSRAIARGAFPSLLGRWRVLRDGGVMSRGSAS